MSTFIIHTHGRLQEWVAEEQGYFAAEGLTDYVTVLAWAAFPGSCSCRDAACRSG